MTDLLDFDLPGVTATIETECTVSIPGLDEPLKFVCEWVRYNGKTKKKIQRNIAEKTVGAVQVQNGILKQQAALKRFESGVDTSLEEIDVVGEVKKGWDKVDETEKFFQALLKDNLKALKKFPKKGKGTMNIDDPESVEKVLEQMLVEDFYQSALIESFRLSLDSTARKEKRTKN